METSQNSQLIQHQTPHLIQNIIQPGGFQGYNKPYLTPKLQQGIARIRQIRDKNID